MKIIVYHTGYGCETGCCGHRIEWTDAAGEEHSVFEFDHPYEMDKLEWAKWMVKNELGEEHIKDLDWEHCVIVND